MTVCCSSDVIIIMSTVLVVLWLVWFCYIRCHAIRARFFGVIDFVYYNAAEMNDLYLKWRMTDHPSVTTIHFSKNAVLQFCSSRLFFLTFVCLFVCNTCWYLYSFSVISFNMYVSTIRTAGRTNSFWGAFILACLCFVLAFCTNSYFFVLSWTN